MPENRDDDQKNDTDEGSRPRLYLPEEESHRRLAPFEREARAGMPDPVLARKAGVSVTSVRFWRRKLGIHHKRGSARRTQAVTAQALDMLGQPLEDVLQRAKASSLNGQWTPPEFIIREGINYDMMMEQCHMLMVCGYSVEQIAEAHGYTVDTVQHAITVFVRYGKETGHDG